MKTNLAFRKKAYFKKHLLINIQQNILPRTMEWLRDATNALEQEDALDTYKVLRNQPERFKNIIIYLGDFHYMKEIFAAMGKLITGSGIEEIIFQSGLCSSGSLNGVVSGSHYNRCWTVHSHLAEAVERLLFGRLFLTTLDETPRLLA